MAGRRSRGDLSVPLGVLGARTGSTSGPVHLPCGVRTGDVTMQEAVIWARGDGPGRLCARLTAGAHVGHVLRGPSVDETSDLTGRLELTGLAPGRAYDAAVWIESDDGRRGEVALLGFRTAPASRRPTALAWCATPLPSTAYRALHRGNPDLVVDLGPGVDLAADPVAQTLEEFRDRHRATSADDELRALRTDTPFAVVWPDHETHLGWRPDAVLDDERYDECRTDVLATRARRAWQEYQPVRSEDVRHRGDDGFAADRIYRRLARGPLLDLFCLDLRTGGVPLLGGEQADWVVREADRSPAVWKALATDHRPDTDDPDLRAMARALHDHGIDGVVVLHPQCHRQDGVAFSRLVGGELVDASEEAAGAFGTLGVAAGGVLTVALHDAAGAVVWSGRLDQVG